MFFAQALRKKLYSNFADKLSKKDECLFPFKLPKKSNINYLYELKSENPMFTHIQLKQMNKSDYLKYFSKKNLQQKWNRKIRVNYNNFLNRFNRKENKKVSEAKKYIKNLVDKDIFQIKPQSWNNSTKFDENKFIIKENIKKLKYETDHCLKNTQLLKNNITPKYNDDNFIIHDDMNNKWNIASKLEQDEKDIMEKELYLKSLNNTQKYWLKNILPLSNNKINKFNNTFVNINNKKIIDSSFDLKYPIFEEKKNNMSTYESYLKNQKYKKDKFLYEDIKKKNINASEILSHKMSYDYWNDKELSKKIQLIENCSESNIFDELNKTYSPQGLKQEMLKNLMYNKEKIKIEEYKIKQEKKYNNYIKRIKNTKNKNPISLLNISKYPMTFKQKLFNENKKESLNDELIKNEENKTFIEACQKVLIEKNNKKVKRVYSCKNFKKSIGKFMYVHPGVYRDFKFKRPRNNRQLQEEKYMAWSCCNNTDKDSKGCEKIFIKNNDERAQNIL